MDAVQLRFTVVPDAAVAVTPVGAVGGCVSPVDELPAARNATICMIHGPLAESGASAL